VIVTGYNTVRNKALSGNVTLNGIGNEIYALLS
jgi:hypothetical protein